MLDWHSLRVLCLGGAGQTGMEICRQLDDKGVEAVVVHDLALERCEAAIEEIRASRPSSRTNYIPSAGNLFHPLELGSWERAGEGFRETCLAHDAPEQEAELLQKLLDARLGPFTREVVRQSLIWNLVDAYRPHVVVDTINTATVLGYRGDVIQSGRRLANLGHRIFEALRDEEPLRLDDLEERIEQRREQVGGDLADALRTSLRMSAFLDTACMIRFVQCLHAIFEGIAEFGRYVKVHTTGLGGMGFNIRYTHGDTGEPGLSTKLLGKVCATGSFSQLLMTLAHTPGCDVRVVVPGTLVGWVEPKDAVIRDATGPLPLVDSRELVPCDASVSLGEALADVSRVAELGRQLEVPYLSSGENNPYAAEDITAITALGQMGCITKEEVSRAVIDSIEGDSRYDILTAMDSAILMPTQTAAVVRDRELQLCRGRREAGARYRLPSISVGNLGPTTAKQLYEIEILRACMGTVERIATQPTEMEMTLRACSYILEDEEGGLLRRQLLSLGIPIYLRKGPDEAGLLLGKRLLYPEPRDLAAMRKTLDDEAIRPWLAKGWIDLTGPRMAWWKERFCAVHEALGEDEQISRNWFDPQGPFTAGQFLAYLYSVSGGQRKQYM